MIKLVQLWEGYYNAPRAFTQLEYSILKKMRLIRFVSPFTESLRRIRKTSFVNKKAFERSLMKLFSTIKSKQVICISILNATPEYESILPGIINKIDEYNIVLRQLGEFVDINGAHAIGGVSSDHHHLNEIGHQHYFECLKNYFETLK